MVPFSKKYEQIHQFFLITLDVEIWLMQMRANKMYSERIPCGFATGLRSEE
jgi:hypothetical protein